jgi:hypothetical protein
MSKTLLTIVLGLSLAGCKTDKAASSSENSPAQEPSNAKPRSAKIDVPSVKPKLPTEAGEDDDRTDQARSERRRQRMAEVDTDGDGVISDAEREAARTKRMQEMKDRLDTNKDGVVSDEERNAARHQRVLDMRAQLDADGDGKVTPAELGASRFGRMDTSTADANGDGNVTAEELEVLMKDRMGRGGFRGNGRGGFGRRGGSGEAPSE